MKVNRAERLAFQAGFRTGRIFSEDDANMTEDEALARALHIWEHACALIPDSVESVFRSFDDDEPVKEKRDEAEKIDTSVFRRKEFADVKTSTE